MSTVWIMVLLIVPIAAVIIALNLTHKRQKQKVDKRNKAYLHQVMTQTGIINGFQKELVHQLVLLDDTKRRLLIIDHVNHTYSHTLYELDDIKGIELINLKRFIPSHEGNKKSESYTSQIGLEIISGNGTPSKQLLVFYDHIKHSVYLMAEMEKKAKQLQQRIKEAKAKKQVILN